MTEPHNDPSSLHEIEDDLSNIETGLDNVSNLRGRAMFSSVNSMLGSLRRRLDEHIHGNGDEEASRLSERLQTAQLAHSNRIPLNLLRSNQSMERRTSISQQRASLLRNASAAKLNDELDGEQQLSSSLVASRKRLEEIESDDLVLHSSASSLSMLPPVFEQKDDRGHSDCNSDCERVAVEGIETPLLLPKDSKGIMKRLSSHHLPGFVMEPDATDECTVYSWGASHLLHDDDKERLAPEESLLLKSERIGRLSDIVSVACGPSHSACATTEGRVYICGDNSCGAVAPNERDEKEVVRPQVLESLGDQTIIRQVSCGWDHTAAVSSTGAVLTWGNNEMRQLGHFVSPSSADAPTTFCRPKVMSLGPGTRAASIACGNQFTMVLTTRMSMLICGKSELAGYGTLPRQLPALVGLPIASVAAGKDHAVVLTIFGTAYSWGKNTSGCCGRPFPNVLSAPVPMVTPCDEHVETPLGVVQTPKLVHHDGSKIVVVDEVAIVHAACGDNHTVLITRSGGLLVCGSNDQGQLGVEESTAVEHLEAVSHPESGRRFVSAEASESNTLLLDDAGDVWQVQDGQLGRVLSGKSILTIATGGKQCIALSHGTEAHPYFHIPEDIEAVSHTTEDLESLIQQISDEPLDENSISASGHELVNRLAELLKYPSVLNSLFLDVSELDRVYGEISAIQNPELRQALAYATGKSILEGLESLQSTNASMKYAGSVRCLLHYVRFFDENEDDSVIFDPLGSCIATLCEAFLNLPFEGFKSILAWIIHYPPDLFVRMLVKPLLSQLDKALRIEVDADGVQHQRVVRRAAPLIGAVLRWLHVVSERAALASANDFYSDAVSKISLETLYEDLQTKKTSVKGHLDHGFLLSENPFLIPPSTKRDLLMIESQVSMVTIATQEPSSVNESEGTVTIDPFFVVEIEREHLLEQTFDAITEAKPNELRKKLRIKFKGEEGVDAGGVTKEFFQLVSEELFDVHSALWTTRFGDGITWFNSDNTWDEKGFELVGLVVGLALYNNVLLDAHFPQAVYRMLLNKPLGMEDLIDKELENGLQQLLDYEGDDVEFIFCLTFEIAWMDLGKEHKVELKPGGADIEVTRDNKEEYVLLYVKWILVDSISLQWEAFKKGVNIIMGGSSLGDLFTPEELELLVVGTPELDFCALESNTKYEGGYDQDSAVVGNLWKFVKNADQETQMHFLKFTTGACKAPIGGLGAMDFKVQRAGPDSRQLPTSHTCFNTLLLPDYGDNYDKLEERLGRAILECEGFGLE